MSATTNKCCDDDVAPCETRKDVKRGEVKGVRKFASVINLCDEGQRALREVASNALRSQVVDQ